MFFLQRIVKQHDSLSVFLNTTNTYAKDLQEKHKGSCELGSCNGVTMLFRFACSVVNLDEMIIPLS